MMLLLVLVLLVVVLVTVIIIAVATVFLGAAAAAVGLGVFYCVSVLLYSSGCNFMPLSSWIHAPIPLVESFSTCHSISLRINKYCFFFVCVPVHVSAT